MRGTGVLFLLPSAVVVIVGAARCLSDARPVVVGRLSHARRLDGVRAQTHLEQVWRVPTQRLRGREMSAPRAIDIAVHSLCVYGRVTIRITDSIARIQCLL